MSRRFRLVILALLAAVLCLSAAVASFAFSGGSTVPADSGAETPAVSSSVSLYVGSNGLWGARTANGRVLIEPTWAYLRVMSDTVLIARRNDGKRDSFGLIRTTGEQLIPFLYSSFEMREPDFWVAGLTDNNQQKYHLYHADGTRWADETWDSVQYSEGELTLTAGRSSYTGTIEDGKIRWTSLHTEYPVGLNMLVLEADETTLQQAASVDELMHLVTTAANYLNYLFVSKKEPDAALVAAENPEDVLAAVYYSDCKLQYAAVSKIRQLSAEDFPRWLVQLQVQYQYTDENEELTSLRTEFDLTLSRNAAGDFTYCRFSDPERRAIDLPDESDTDEIEGVNEVTLPAET